LKSGDRSLARNLCAVAVNGGGCLQVASVGIGESGPKARHMVHCVQGGPTCRAACEGHTPCQVAHSIDFVRRHRHMVLLSWVLLALKVLLVVWVGLLHQATPSWLALRRRHWRRYMQTLWRLTAYVSVVTACVEWGELRTRCWWLIYSLAVLRLDLRKFFAASTVVVVLSSWSMLGPWIHFVH
jgi:hypothetical protein